MLSSTTALPRPIRERQVRIERTAPRAQLRGRVEASNLDAALEAPRGFVSDLTRKLAEGCVEDRPGQLGFRHPPDVQVLDADAIVLPPQVGCQLVKKSLLWFDTFRCTRATRCLAFSLRRLPSFFLERSF